MEKIKSTFQYNAPHPEQRNAIASNITINVNEAPREVVQDVFAYYFGLRIFANACAKAGNFEVDSVVQKGEKVIYALLDVKLNYADHALRMTIKRDGGQRNMVEWMREKDLHTRG